MWVDSHCHLNHERFDGADPHTIATEATQQGVDKMVSICCRIHDEFEDIQKIANAHRDVWCTIGTHPHEAGHEKEQAITQAQIVEMANADDNVIGIGESGLDYYYDNTPRDAQAQSFRKHIRACIETNLPLIIHARDADDDIIQILKEEGSGTKLKGLLHCFSSKRPLAEFALDIGFYVSFSGIVTFKSAAEIQDVAKDVPNDRILVETDAPFLAPIPYRGKTNHPAYVAHTGEFVANLRGQNVKEFAKLTTDNFYSLFTKANASS